MANEDGNEDRLTMNEFQELIQHLPVQEILNIEYRIGTKWKILFMKKKVAAPTYFCNLCALETSSFKNLLAHIDGRKHRLQMESVEQLYHCDYTYPKIENKVEKKEATEEDVVKSNENDTANVTSEDVIILPVENPIVIEIDEEKTSNVEKNSTEPAAKFEKNNAKSAAKFEKNNTKSAAKFEKNHSTANKATTTKVQPLTDDDKKNEQGKDGSETKEENLEISAAKIPEAVKEKPIIKEKRSLDDINTEEDGNLKKRKLVVNPAAKLSTKANLTKEKEEKNEESNNKPQYQTDKVIIPTIHKNKSSNPKALPTQPNDPPKFSAKPYSSNPSDNDIHGILGVEYVIKILKSRHDISPRYECGLCELVFDGFAMQRHLEGYNHRLKYCEKHFPTAIRQYRQYMQNVPEHEIFKVMTPVLVKLAVAIEQHHGRNLPYECFERDFSLNRHEILAKVFSCRHASEQYGPTFTHVVSSKDIDELISNRQIYMPPPFSRFAIFDKKAGGSSSNKYNDHHQNTDKESNSRDRHRHAGRQNAISIDNTYKSYMSSNINEDMHSSTMYMQPTNRNVSQRIDDETYNLMVDDFLKGTLKGLPRNSGLHDNRKRSLSPPMNANSVKRKSLSPLRDNDIWQAYRHMVDQELYNINDRFKQYRNDPETHPSYNDEWQKFWKRRKDELVSAGLDHRKHNYQPEWVRFIKIRIEELYSEEVENIKLKARERLFLPLTNDNIADVKYHVQASNINPTNDFLPAGCNMELPKALPTPATSMPSSNNSCPQVVSVLRLMTALEDSLGSLGPKVIDLLSKALQTEKTNPLLVNAIILNDENCSIIETAKEKLKGILMTGLFDGAKKRVLNQVVNDTETLLQYAYNFKQQLASQRSLVEMSTSRTQYNSFSSLDPSVSLSSGLTKDQPLSFSKAENSLPRSWEKNSKHLDKKELASKLAASLVAQGKTDFDPQQLQQLITVYKLIEKKKRESGGTVQSNKSVDSSSSIKKALSDTLSDLLKPSSSAYPTSTVSNMSNASHSVPSLSCQTSGDPRISNSFRNLTPTSNLQNPSGNNFNNTVQSVPNSFVSNRGGGNQFEQRSSYGSNYLNHVQPNQQNFNVSNMYNNQYPNNNGMTQNWGRNSNMEMNQNYNVPGTNNFNQNPGWQNF